MAMNEAHSIQTQETGQEGTKSWHPDPRKSLNARLPLEVHWAQRQMLSRFHAGKKLIPLPEAPQQATCFEGRGAVPAGLVPLGVD